MKGMKEMMGINIEDIIPRWLLWACAIPFMILLIPIGIFYSLLCLWHELKSGNDFVSYKHDIIFAIGRPGFYVGLIIAIALMAAVIIPLNKIKEYI
jgi:hypothetical protein